MLFGKFRIAPNQIFYRSPSLLTAAIVNLRPIVPGHVLVVPRRVVPLLSDLTDDEHDDLWRSVRAIQNALRSHLSAGGFNVAVQDGRDAGQSVPHVHVHILPRLKGDFARNDDVYDALEEWAPRDNVRIGGGSALEVAEDEDRINRTLEQMAKEAASYRSLFEP